jgi:hypothetical protein
VVVARISRGAGNAEGNALELDPARLGAGPPTTGVPQTYPRRTPTYPRRWVVWADDVEVGLLQRLRSLPAGHHVVRRKVWVGGASGPCKAKAENRECTEALWMRRLQVEAPDV